MGEGCNPTWNASGQSGVWREMGGCLSRSCGKPTPHSYSGADITRCGSTVDADGRESGAEPKAVAFASMHSKVENSPERFHKMMDNRPMVRGGRAGGGDSRVVPVHGGGSFPESVSLGGGRPAATAAAGGGAVPGLSAGLLRAVLQLPTHIRFLGTLSSAVLFYCRGGGGGGGQGG